MNDTEKLDFEAKPPAGYAMQPGVENWAEGAMFAHVRAMTMEEKLEHIAEFWRIGHRVRIAGLALRFPDATEDELELRAAEIRLGKETVAALLAAGVPPPWTRR